ncbi:MAG: preprotein translocase subunit YajC [Pseudomonadota bacterium]|nr:preprotein translocase subunit YajC [Pseudomonadota bacterium]
MFISPAFAQSADAVSGPGLGMQLLPILLIFVVFYFLLIRPQQKRMSEHQTMINKVRRGDKIVTVGGLIGNISRMVGEDEIVVELSENTKVRVMRGYIANVLERTEPAEIEKPAKTGK